MTNLKPGQNTRNKGGIYEEVDQNNVRLQRYATIRDNQIVPPTSKTGNSWKPVKITPNNKRK